MRWFSENKVVPICCVEDSGIHDHADVYISHVPKDVLSRSTLYLQPLPKIPVSERSAWFTCSPLGINKIK